MDILPSTPRSPKPPGTKNRIDIFQLRSAFRFYGFRIDVLDLHFMAGMYAGVNQGFIQGFIGIGMIDIFTDNGDTDFIGGMR